MRRGVHVRVVSAHPAGLLTPGVDDEDGNATIGKGVDANAPLH